MLISDSNNLIASLREQIQAQSAQGQQSRSLQQQLRERDAEVAQYRSQAEEATTQLSAAQNEAKALQTKLTAARNTAASLEGAARAPGSAAKNTPANRAQTAEAAQAAQFAQLKEDLYSDLTGLIIRDVKKRESDHLYDCIQTGVNGSRYPQFTGLTESSTNGQPSTSNWPFHMSLLPTTNSLSFSIFPYWTKAGIASWWTSCPTISRWTLPFRGSRRPSSTRG